MKSQMPNENDSPLSLIIRFCILFFFWFCGMGGNYIKMGGKLNFDNGSV